MEPEMVGFEPMPHSIFENVDYETATVPSEPSHLPSFEIYLFSID